MNTKKTIILAVFMLLFAIFAVAVSAQDNSCLDCHEKLTAFSEKERELNEIRIKHLQRDVACSLECHATTIDKFAKSNYEQWTNSKHALFNVTCDNCHSGNTSSDVKEIAHAGVLRSSETNSTVFYRNVPETCGKCHINELNQFKDSLHYQRLKALKQAPTCDTCHGPHEFKVLNVSEFEGLCSSCHNTEMKIAPDIPERAVDALENTQHLKDEIRNAQDAIKQAKQQGRDVTVAQKELDSAIAIQDNLPILWHSFNLPHFQNVTDNGINYARTSQIDAGFPPEKPSTPGFGTILTLIGIVSIYIYCSAEDKRGVNRMNKKRMNQIILMVILVLLLFVPSLASARPEYAVKESRNCPFCHTRDGPPQLNDIGVYYANNNHSMVGYVPAPTVTPTPEPEKEIEIGVHMTTWDVGLRAMVMILLLLAVVYVIRL